MRQVMARAHLGDELVGYDDTGRGSGRGSRTRSAAGYELVVAAGGDGTVGTVAEPLLGTPTALGILPLGTVMNVARSLGIPRDLDGAADVIATGRVREIDVGQAGDRPFFEAGRSG